MSMDRAIEVLQKKHTDMKISLAWAGLTEATWGTSISDKMYTLEWCINELKHEVSSAKAAELPPVSEWLPSSSSIANTATSSYTYPDQGNIDKRAREEAEEVGDGWIEWEGAGIPSPRTLVEVRLKSGSTLGGAVADFGWQRTGGNGDIVAYRAL